MPPIMVRIQRIFQHQGLWMVLLKAWIIIVDRLYDIRYGIETCRESLLNDLSIEGKNRQMGRPYQATRVIPLRSIFKMLRPILPKDSVLVDLGAGKGRVLLVASEFGFQEVVGVEFARELTAIAKKNGDIYMSKTKTRIGYHVVEADVSEYPIRPVENVFFMNNPFDKEILQKVLDNISASLRQHYRKIYIIYFTPSGREAIESRSDFFKVKEGNLWGYNFALYSNT
jgi:16S rRNA G966 N2-methylase RsmD